ncbi:MAG TPA: hypothetical protein VHG32_14010 [Thermoanaerobaculia bacterium]|jgi:hypothetical protein|nr:hypothetical protein [Thermoanaerobaculia bacterium]
MEKLNGACQTQTDQSGNALDFQQLSPDAMTDLDGSALGLIVKDVLEKKTEIGAKHSSHSSYTQYSTYSMGPIG